MNSEPLTLKEIINKYRMLYDLRDKNDGIEVNGVWAKLLVEIDTECKRVQGIKGTQGFIAGRCRTPLEVLHELARHELYLHGREKEKRDDESLSTLLDCNDLTHQTLRTESVGEMFSMLGNRQLKSLFALILRWLNEKYCLMLSEKEVREDFDLFVKKLEESDLTHQSSKEDK